MKTIKSIAFLSLALILVSFLFQCTTIPKLEKKAPTTIENVYFLKWNAGTQEGGSGINFFIETKDASVTFGSLYFRGQQAELKPKPNNDLLYLGCFKSNGNMSNDSIQESSNFPFQLKNNECVISYLKDNKVRYFKISNVIERQSINYPTSPQNE